MKIILVSFFITFLLTASWVKFENVLCANDDMANRIPKWFPDAGYERGKNLFTLKERCTIKNPQERTTVMLGLPPIGEFSRWHYIIEMVEEVRKYFCVTDIIFLSPIGLNCQPTHFFHDPLPRNDAQFFKRKT